MFVTLKWEDHIRDNVVLLWLSNCDTTIVVTLQHYYVHHVAISSLVCQIAKLNYVYRANIEFFEPLTVKNKEHIFTY